MAANINENLIARYLLGELSEEQQIEIEDRAFADQEYLAGITAVENDLIDEYVRHELSESDRRRFEERFLASAARRKRVEFAKALASVESEVTVPQKTVVSPTSACCRVRPASREPARIDTSSKRNSRLPSCMTTSRNSTTLGCSAAAAIRWPPIRCGLTTRVAPARSSFGSDSSVRALATITRSGLSARADSVT